MDGGSNKYILLTIKIHVQLFSTSLLGYYAEAYFWHPISMNTTLRKKKV